MSKFFGVLAITLTLIFLMPLLTTLLGAFSGWVVGLFFSETFLTFFSSLGIVGLKMWQIGAVLGFVGGFFRTTANNQS